MLSASRGHVPTVTLFVVIMAYAIATLMSGAERLEFGSSSNAMKRSAALALTNEDPATAKRWARRTVLANPSDSEAVEIFATASMAAGEREPAAEAFAVAGQSGWRHPATQLFWFETAIGAQDWPLAAERLDAFLRVRPSFREMNALLGLLETRDSEAQKAVADRMRYASPWRKRYLASLNELPDEQLVARAQVLEFAGAGKTGLACKDIAPITGELLVLQAVERAQRIWGSFCPVATISHGLFDPDFVVLAQEGELPGLGWQLHPTGNVSIEVHASGRNRTAKAQASGPVLQLVMSQSTSFREGTYQIVAGGVSESDAKGIVFELSCEGRLDRPQGNPDRSTSQSISVPENCRRQRLAVWLKPDEDSVSWNGFRVTPKP